MKRTFLTSGLVLCMACPAFAANVTGNNDECVEEILGVSAQGSTANIEAVWTANKSGRIVLNPNVYPSNTITATELYNTTTGNEKVTASSPADVFSIYNTGMYNYTEFSSANPTAITSITIPSKAGYTFNGFYNHTPAEPVQTVDNNGNFTSVAKTQIQTAGDDAVWYAHWTPITYTVTYDKGAHAATGVNNHVDTDGATYDVNYAALTAGTSATNSGTSGIYPAAGYTFAGWTMDSTPTFTNGTLNNAWTGEEPWKYTSDQTVYAAYSANSYNVVYGVGTNGTGNPYTDTNGITFAGDYTVLSLSEIGNAGGNIAAATGYHFVDFTSNYPANSTHYNPGASITGYNDPGNLELIANFAANVTNITYACTGDNVTGTAPAADSATYGNGYTFPANTCEKSGYTFQGWSCTGLSGTQTVDGNSITWSYEGEHNGSMTCTPVFGANTINLSWYEDEDATEPMSVDSASQTCIYDGSITVPAAPNKTGYTFQGWSVRGNN